MRTVLRIVVTLVVVMLGTSGGPTARAQMDSPCDAADALRTAKLYDEAISTYGSLLTEDPNTPCAHASIESIVTIRQGAAALLAQGKVYEGAQQRSQAIDAYARALVADPELTDARDALLNLTDTVPDDTTFAVVYALRSAGFHDAAAAKLKETVEKHPSSTVPTDLQYLVPKQKSVRQWLRAHGPLSWLDIPNDRLAIGGVVLASIVLVGLRFRPRRVRMDIEDLVEGKTKDASGVALSARLEEALFRLWTGPSHPNLQFVEGPVQGFNIPADLALPTQVKLLAGVLDWLFPPKLVLVGGYMQQLPDRGAGLTLRLLQKPQSGVIETVTIWQEDFLSTAPSKKVGSAQAFDDLVEPAALWVLYRLSERTGHTISPPYPRDWRSHAAFRSGVYSQKRGDLVAASRCYHRAVTLDPDNLDALINLAILEADEKKYDRAISRLQHVQTALKRTPRYPEDMRWYIVRYQLAASHDYAGYPRAAEPEARALLSEIDQAIEAAAHDQAAQARRTWLEKRWTELLGRTIQRTRRQRDALQRRTFQSLIVFLKANRSSIVVMYATILKENGKSTEAQAQLAGLPSSDRPPLLAYNLACYHSEAREFLVEALEGQPERAEEAGRDPSLDVLRTEMGHKFQRLLKTYE